MAKGGTNHMGKVINKAPKANKTDHKVQPKPASKLPPCLSSSPANRLWATMRAKAGVISQETSTRQTTTTTGVIRKMTTKGATTAFKSGKPTPSNQRHTVSNQLEASKPVRTSAMASSQYK